MTSTLAPTRRDVLRIAGAVTLASSAVTGTAALAQNETGRGLVKAVDFDAFTIFDPRSVDAAVEGIFPGKGKEWRRLGAPACSNILGFARSAGHTLTSSRSPKRLSNLC